MLEDARANENPMAPYSLRAWNCPNFNSIPVPPERGRFAQPALLQRDLEALHLADLRPGLARDKNTG